MIEQVKNIDPIIVNSDGSLHGVVEKEVCDQNMVQFIAKVNTFYDLNPIFQRGDVWSLEMKGRLITSIFLKIPIGPVTLCEKQYNVAYKNVIDAKQRSLALKDWWAGKFAIPVVINDKLEFLTWNQIKDSSNPILINMRQTFESYKVIEVIYKNMSLARQAKQFEIINTFVPPQNEELLYGYNYFAKGLYRYIFDHALSNILKHISNTQERTNKHEKGTIYAHRICYTCFGGEFDDTWAIRALGNSKIQKPTRPALVRDTEKINNLLAERLESEKVEEIDENFITKLPFNNKIEDLAKLCDALAEVLKCANGTSKKMKKNDLFDCIIFFMKRILDKTLTIAMIKNDKAAFLKVITSYMEKKSQAGDMTGQSVTTKKIKQRDSLFSEVYESKISDLGVKNKPIPAVQRSIALMKAPSHCPITGEVLTDENVAIDHVNAKSLSSETNYVAVSQTGNLWKSNRTPEEIDAVRNYMQEVGGVK